MPPADPDALAVALNMLLDNPSLRQAYGDAGRQRAQQQFSAEIMAERTLALYQRVMSQPPGAPLPAECEFTPEKPEVYVS